MFKNRIGYSLLLFLILAGTISASIPPHERLMTMIRDGAIPKPYFIQHYQELKGQGLNAPWREVLKKKGIKINSSGPGILNKNSTTAVNCTFKMLVILVDFPDKPRATESTVFDNLAFGTTQGTLRHYYNSLSSGTFDIVTVNEPSSTGWIQMPNPYSYYVNGHNGNGYYPNNVQKLAEDACEAADGIVDFKNYDNDGDGFVDGLIIVHSGAGAEYTFSNDDIWSHTYEMYQPFEHDGVKTYAYSMLPEYFANAGDMTCGVFVHECAHLIFGLPDLYDINDPSGYGGLGKWSLMAAGSWNGHAGPDGHTTLGDSPAFPDAWSRSQMHWGTAQFATVQNINSNRVNQQILNVENSSSVYKVWKHGAIGSEYFMIENRQQTGYDSFLPGNGLLIYHVDELFPDNTREWWYPGNTTNGHYKVALEQADGQYALEKKYSKGEVGDPFPGSTNNRSFSSSSGPNSNDYNGNPTYVEVTNISNAASAMTADIYMGNVIVSQTLSDNLTQVGTVGRWNGSSFNTRLTPDQPFSVIPETDEILQGDQGIYSNHKYYIWARNFTKENNILNHHVFNVQPRDIKYDSRFSPIITNVTIQNLLDGSAYLSSPDNKIDFLDPWFINYKDPNYGYTLRNQGTAATFISRPSPFSPNTTNLFENNKPYNGVLLNQTVPSGAFYSVRAPLILPIDLGGTIGTRDYYFQNWVTANVTLQQNGANPSGYDQKAVVFNADNASVTANYKGHLLSNTLSATGSNGSQRKIVKDYYGHLHMVYESVGKIWYTTSTDGGTTWSAEQKISGSGVATSASIAASEDGDPCNDVFCVWQETVGSTRNLYRKLLMFPEEPPLLLDSDASTVDLQPSVAVSSDDYNVLVAYKKMNLGRYQMFYKYSEDGGRNFPYGGTVLSGIPVVGNNPSIAWNQSLGKFMVSVTSTSGQLQVNLYGFDCSSRSWALVTSIYSSSQIPLAPVYSQVAVDGTGRTHVSWIGYDDFYGNNSASMHMSYYVDEDFNAIYSDVSVFRDEVIYDPSIVYTTVSGHSDAVDGGVSIFYSPEGQVGLYNMVSTNGTSWNGITYITPTAPIKYPTSLEKAQAGSVSYVASKGSTLPYQVAMQTVNNTRSGLSYELKSSSENVTSSQGMENVKTFRRIEIIDTTNKTPGRLVVQMGNFKGRSLSFHKSDSLKKKEASLSSFMRSEGFTFDKDASFSTDLFIKKTGWNGDLKLRLELVEEGSEKILQKVYEGSLGVKDSTSEERTLKVANRLGKLKAYLRVSLDGIGKENLIVNNMDVYLLNSGKERAEKPEKEMVESENAPVEYALSQNYPNPFNPSTVINYEIPKTSRVILKIFDMLGKEVTTLVNEYKEQGRYSVEFNASNLPSGTYIYELRANDFVKSGKMLLLK